MTPLLLKKDKEQRQSIGLIVGLANSFGVEPEIGRGGRRGNVHDDGIAAAIGRLETIGDRLVHRSAEIDAGER